MSGRSLFTKGKSSVPGILHNSQQGGRRASDQINQEGGLAIYPEVRRPPDDILMLISCL
jgi:hypothetical protein